MGTSTSILIIGAGIAGLSTGCYAQMNGYRARIYELHDKPGGLCAAWKRKGYTIDGCTHHLAGVGPTSRLYPLWQELGAVPGRGAMFLDDLVRMERPDGQGFTFYTDLVRLEQHLKELSPTDGAVIDEYLRAIRSFAGVEFLAIPSFGAWDVIRALPQLMGMLKWFKISMAEYAQRFSHPFLRQAFPWAQYDFANIPMAVHLAFMAGCAEHTLGWPVGGSLEFARAIEQRYLALGGEMHYRARVTQVLVENDRAVGVRLADGSEVRADVVISAADGRSTIMEMLGGRYTDEAIRAYYAAAPARQEMAVQVSFGVARDLTHEAHALTLFLDQPVTLSGEMVERLDVENYAFEPSFAPAGKAVLKVMLSTRYDYWASLRERRADYDAEKERLATTVLALLERRFPGLTAQVEMTDVSTPLTTERFTANYHGLQAWGRPNAKAMDALKPFTTTLPGLGGFYMVGQWAGATIGLSTAAIAGRKLMQRLCKEDGKRFVAMRM